MKKEILKDRWAGEEMKTVRLKWRRWEEAREAVRRKGAREGGQGEDELREDRFIGTVHADRG